MQPGTCPTPGELVQLLDEDLPDADRTVIEAHVETCAHCQERLEKLVAPTTTLFRGLAIPPVGVAQSVPESDEAFLARLRQYPPAEPDGCGAPATPSDDDRVPSHIGPYEILGQIGRGGMGAVYKARHRELDRVVALKVLPADRVGEASVARFRTEMRAAGQLNHTNIVAATDAGRVGDIHFLVTEFVDGLDLSRLVSRRGPLPVPDACEIVRQAATGLRHTHERGLIHRDVKPSNLMLARGGVVKVLDLGLARLPGTGPRADGLTAPGAILGTADYIAPEQIEQAHAVGDRADVYSLGATLYFLMTGEPPFGGDRHRSWLDKLRAHQLESTPPLAGRRPDAPTGLGTLIEKMMAKDPADRPTAAEVAVGLRPFTAGADLRGLLRLADVVEGPATVDPRAETISPEDTRHGVPRTRPGGKRTRVLAVAALVAGVALVAFLWREFGHTPAPTPPDPARILGVEVRHVRDTETSPVGVIGVDRMPILLNDGVRFSVKLNAPAYCYLIAFNPDGREQLCHPGAETEERAAPPPKVAELQFPQDGSHYFVLDRVGHQAFVLVASARPLPPYAEWRARAGTPPWKPDANRTGGVWRLDGAWTELAARWELTPVPDVVAKLKLPDFMRQPSGGGHVAKLGTPPPKALGDLAAFFQDRPEFDAIQILAFPVFRSPD
jgi:hypothetical protein